MQNYYDLSQNNLNQLIEYYYKKKNTKKMVFLMANAISMAGYFVLGFVLHFMAYKYPTGYKAFINEAEATNAPLFIIPSNVPQ